MIQDAVATASENSMNIEYGKCGSSQEAVWQRRSIERSKKKLGFSEIVLELFQAVWYIYRVRYLDYVVEHDC